MPNPYKRPVFPLVQIKNPLDYCSQDAMAFIESATYDELCFAVRQLRIPKDLQKTILALDHEALQKALTRLVVQAHVFNHTTCLQQEKEEF